MRRTDLGSSEDCNIGVLVYLVRIIIYTGSTRPPVRIAMTMQCSRSKVHRRSESRKPLDLISSPSHPAPPWSFRDYSLTEDGAKQGRINFFSTWWATKRPIPLLLRYKLAKSAPMCLPLRELVPAPAPEFSARIAIRSSWNGRRQAMSQHRIDSPLLKTAI
jgi:hypothetical protein